jgi:SulP family sulfate permease
LFGATSKLDETTSDLPHFGKIVILRLRNMTAIDATGLHALEAFAKRVKSSGRTLLTCGARRQPAKLIKTSEFAQLIGEANMLPHVQAALDRAREIHQGEGG